MGKSNIYEIPSEAVTIYLDRYCAQRLLLALTQALDPGSDQYEGKKKTKKGKGGSLMSGMKLSKKGGKTVGAKRDEVVLRVPGFLSKLGKGTMPAI